MLDVFNLSSGYGDTRILFDLSLNVGKGDVVAVLGRNGAGKTTLLKTIVGTVACRQGEVRFEGTTLNGQRPYQIARRGICLVPEERRIFALLTVEENIKLAQRQGSVWGIADVYELFPRLAERRRNKGDRLSGGEQQMLAIARALVNAPKLIMLDEPMEGLAPVIIDEIIAAIHRIKREGVSIIIVEQNIDVCREISDRHYLVEMGRIIRAGTSREIEQNRSAYEKLLGVEG